MFRINKIIFLHEHQFIDYYYHAFGIETLEGFGYDVEVWNFTPFLQNEMYLRDNVPCTRPWPGHILFKDKESAVDAITKLTPSSFVITGVHLTLATLPLYRALSKRGVPCASLLAVALPLGTFPQKQKYQNKIKLLFRLLSWSRLRDKLFSMIPFRYLGIRPVDLIFAMGEKFLKSGYPADGNSEVLWTHFFDYDTYLQEKDRPCEINHKTGVFLDEYLPYHSDNIACNLSHVPADKYYAQLRNFFDDLESRFKAEIIIAAHPRSHYEDKPALFGKRTVIRGKTSELVKQSGFVILHQSMSLNYAVLYRKPMIFTITDDAEKYLIEDPHPQWLAHYFGKSLHNLDRVQSIDLPEEMKINDQAYRSYKNDFIKKEGSADLHFWQIVAKRIEQYQ